MQPLLKEISKKSEHKATTELKSQCFVDRVWAASVATEAPQPDSAAAGSGATGSVTTQCAKIHMAAGSWPTRRHGVGFPRSSTALSGSHGESQPRTIRSADRQRTSWEHCNDCESTRPPATYTVPFSTAQPKKLRPTLNLFRRSQRI